MEIPKELNNEIWEYCRANNRTNIDEFILKLLKQGFTAEKFGATPTTKTIEKIVEKTVEIPVDKIIEKIVEVPVNVVDSEMTEKYSSLLKQFEELKQENKVLKEALEKEKNKKDLYGE